MLIDRFITYMSIQLIMYVQNKCDTKLIVLVVFNIIHMIHMHFTGPFATNVQKNTKFSQVKVYFISLVIV